MLPMQGSTPPHIDPDAKFKADQIARLLGVHTASVERHCTPVETIRLYTLGSVRDDLRSANIRTSGDAA